MGLIFLKPLTFFRDGCLAHLCFSGNGNGLVLQVCQILLLVQTLSYRDLDKLFNPLNCSFFFFICEIRLIFLPILRLIGSNKNSLSEFCKKCQINIRHSLLNYTEVSHFPRETWWNSWVSLARTFLGGKVSPWGSCV